MPIRAPILCWLILLSSSVCTTSAASPSTPPNILFVIADDWGVHAGAYGTPWVRTPNFDRVAKDGILFTNVYTPNAKCAPSRAAILTGRNSWQLKEAANHLCYFPPEFKGWGEALAEHGWHVGHTTKGWGPGVAKDAAGNPRAMTGKAFNAKKATPPTSEIGATDYAANFDDFLEASPQGKPWAFWCGLIEPHRGYEFGSGLKKGGYQLSSIDHVPKFWPDNEVVRTDMLDYAYEVEHVDNHLGRMLASLQRRGLLENTLVIVTSDHGMPFPRGKGSAYEYSNHVPFAVMWPQGIKGRGRTVTDYVSFVDLAPTFIEVAGLTWSQTGMAESPGLSLTDIFRSPKSGRVNPQRDHVLIGMERHDIGRPNDVGYPIRGIVKDNFLYLENFEPSRWPACNPETGYLNVDGGATKTFILEARRAQGSDPFWTLCFGRRPGTEFYDLNKDRDCVINLDGTLPTSSLQAQLKEELYTRLKAQGDPRMFGQGEIFDHYPHSNPANIHFYERYMRGEQMKTNWVNPSDFEKVPLD
ncbi:MAG TPA: sulfatase [Opitutaceae bacterium]|nr:sulfatase [Opitutaceae bacterium]